MSTFHPEDRSYPQSPLPGRPSIRSAWRLFAAVMPLSAATTGLATEAVITADARPAQVMDARDGAAAIRAGREAIAALGFSPDDPLALAAYRAEIQSEPNVVDAVGDFQLNTTWGNGGLAGDRYASSDSGAYQGIKAAMLSTGETIVLGSIRFSSTGPLDFGLTKRAANGSRVTWSGVDSQFGIYSNQYIVYPNTNTTLPTVYSVKDMKVSNDRIYVLYTGHLNDINTYGPVIVCFNADGSGCGWWFAGYQDAAVSDGVAMDIYAGRFVVLGRHALGDSGGFWTWVGDINSSGGLENFVYGDFPTPGGYDRASPADVAFRRAGALLPINGTKSYYVLFTKKWVADTSNHDYDPCLLAVKSDTETDTTFGTNGLLCRPFDETGSAKTDRAVALTTNGWGTLTQPHEGVQVLASVARSVDAGIGVWELLDRVNHPDFGSTTGAAGEHGRGGGRAVYGGCGQVNGSNQGEGCLFLTRSAMHSGMDLANVGGDVVVVGNRYGNGLLIGDNNRYYSSLLLRIQGDSGEMEQFTTFPSGYSEGWFNSLVARNAKDVIAVGAAIDTAVTEPTARTQIMTGLTSDDVIFSNGFD